MIHTNSMGINFNLKTGPACGGDSPLNQWTVERYYKSCGCDNCPPGCPDFIIRRHDTKPPFKVSVEDCDGPMDLNGLVVEANMWAVGRLRDKLEPTDTFFRLADNIGFGQATVGDVILFDRPRQPEYMLITGFDEDNNLIQVQRGYRGTTPGRWKRGSNLRIFRIMGAPAEVEIQVDDVKNPDGTVDKDVIQNAMLVYEWQPGDTCLSGCFWFEFKIIKMLELVVYTPGGHWIGPVTQNDNGIYYTGSSITDASVAVSYDSVHDRYVLPNKLWSDAKHVYNTNYFTGSDHNDGSVFLSRTDISADVAVPFGGNSALDAADSLRILSVPSEVSVSASFNSQVYQDCILGEGVEWIRRMPLSGEGFLIRVEDSPTREH